MKREHWRLLIFFLISASVLGFVIARTVTSDTIIAISNMSSGSLLIILIIWVADYSSDAASIYILAQRSTTGKLSIVKAFQIPSLRSFFNITTPFNSGGGPAVVIALEKSGIPFGEGISISLIRLLGISAWYFLFSFISTILLFVKTLHTSSVFVLVIGLFVLLAGMVYIILFISFIHPKTLILLSKAIFFLGKKSRLIKTNNTMKKILHEAFITRKCIKDYLKYKKDLFFLAMTANFLSALSQILLMIVILNALGMPNESLLELFIRSSLLIFLIRFMPTPGGVGFGEGLYLLLFSDIVPIHLLGIAVLIWRIFLNYSKAAVGAFVLSAMYSR